MSLQLAARHLADQGRGPDTELIHMGRGEIDALQGLARAAGGSLTTNPQTGLPEAGFLTSLLPMVAGAALTPFSGGLINPWTASALVGGVTGLATGNLKKGLMAGLGAYGGFGLGSALGAAGAGAGAASSAGAAGSVPTAASAAVPEAATSFAAPSVAPSGTFVGGQKLGEYSALTGGQSAMPMNAGIINPVTPVSPMAPPVIPPVVPPLSPIDKFAAMGRGVTNFDPLKYAAENKLTTAAAFAPVVSSALKPDKYKEAPEDADRGTEYDYDPGTVSPFPTSDETEQRYFNPRYIPRTTSRFAVGGIADGLSSAQSHLGSYSAGGRGRLLRGPGDGVSDSIPATIGGKQPARLADGEFVIPARIVSELGNGSTEAGSKQLYAMMDRIQRARRKTTGKNKVATNTKAHKLMPA